MNTRIFLFILTGICVSLTAAHATTVNMDCSANYSSGWSDGANEGGGFDAWVIDSSSGDFGILSSTNAGLSMGNAFGFTALGADATITLARDFTTPLANGDIFEMDLGMNYGSGSDDGSKGFVLYTADGREIITVNQGKSTNITVNGSTALNKYGTATMYWTITQNSATEISVYTTGRGGESESYFKTIELAEESYLAGISFYANGITNDASSALRAVYFDNLTLSQGASSDTAFSYSIENGEATITEIAKDSASALIIPGALGGYPVTEIARAAGAGCTNITSLSFVDGGSITNIGPNAFQGCAALQAAALPDGIAAIPDSLFYGCISLMSVTIPEDVTGIGNSAFAECRVLSAIALPDGLITLGESVFLNTRNLRSLRIPDGITEIPGQLCYECRALTALTLSANTASIGPRAFYNCGFQSLDIPASVTNVADAALKGCSALKTLTFDGTLSRVGDEAFYGCDSLESIYFNGGVDVLSDAVFGQTDSLTALYFKCDIPTLEDGEDLFIGNEAATIYYIASPSAWNRTLSGTPVTVWAPQITSLSIAEKTLQVSIEWGSEGDVILQSCTNLRSGQWTDICTNTIADGTCTLSDPDTLSSRQNYYRVIQR